MNIENSETRAQPLFELLQELNQGVLPMVAWETVVEPLCVLRCYMLRGGRPLVVQLFSCDRAHGREGGWNVWIPVSDPTVGGTLEAVRQYAQAKP